MERIVLATGGGAVLLPEIVGYWRAWLRGVPEDLGGSTGRAGPAGARPAAAEQCGSRREARSAHGDPGSSLCAARGCYGRYGTIAGFATSQKTSCGNSTLSRRVR